MMSLTNIARAEGDPKVLQTGPSSLGAADRLGRWLGWLSFGLGAVELIAPGRITRALGLDGKEAWVRACGMREIGAGMLSLSADKQAGLWSRVAGDVIDAAVLLPALRADNPKRGNAGLALAAVVAIAALDLIAAQSTTVRHRRSGRPRDFGDRSGFPQGVEAARGAARDFKTPADTRAAPVLAENLSG